MERLQTFCDTASQSLAYPQHEGPVTMMTPEMQATHSGQGCSKQMMRTARSLGQAPYCCPSTSQQSKLLYNLLSNWPKDGPEQMSCLPIIEHQPVCHQTHFQSSSESSASGPSTSNPPPFQFEFKGPLVPDTGRDLLMPYCRQRSQSMGSNGWSFIDMSRTSSHDSLTSYDSVSDENLRNHSPNQQQSEVLLEVTRKKLMNLLMGGNGAEHPGSPHSQSPASQDEDMRSLSQPGSPPSNQSSQEVCRKYSEGSQRVHIKAKLQSARARYDHLPVDLSCKRKKFIRNVAKQSLIEGIEADILPDEGIDECGDHSILKSVLTGRGRSNSLSVFELRRLCMAGRSGAEGRNGHALLNINSDLSQLTGRISGRQRVTLAKKNLLPVIARISDRLNKIVEFAKSLPEFMRLSLADQKALLTNACPRLLLLYMAETNLQFAVTTVPDAGIQLPPSASASNSSLNGASQVEWETPTMQFVECVQNFIRKCQTVGISANEYFYMRMITLFHTGAGTLERSHLADQMYSEARQDLQDLVQHNHPTEKLRYSTLLLSLHTLFGIHCGMLQTLFCKHLTDNGGIGAFINDALNAAAAASAEESTPSN